MIEPYEVSILMDDEPHVVARKFLQAFQHFGILIDIDLGDEGNTPVIFKLSLTPSPSPSSVASPRPA